jgi:hypothetical protein
VIRLATLGYGGVPLIELPLRCICGSQRLRVIVGGRAYSDDP